MKALPESVEAAYITSCDVPLLVPGFVRLMIDLLGDHDIAVMEIDGFPHPLSAVYRRSILPHVEALLADNRLRPAFLFEACRVRRLGVRLGNWLTPEQGRRLLKCASPSNPRE